MIEHLTSSTKETFELGGRLGRKLAGGQVILLDGPLGAGKTVLAQGIANGLGILDAVTSPTFTIINEYNGRLTLYHADLYRISSEEEYDQLALEELVNNRSIAVVEWPDIAGDHLPDSAYRVTIQILDDGRRRVCIPDELER